ncbi:hypothetical protein BVG79_01252 [Ketogulonicigenium robustum]|uniref:ABC transporter domain-containing protein n=1 Tax=Ketogulonicigenium robustum TaxID=92947 RepID=A0A1W6NZB8_9RHOB|nr:ATP-binding cassette domain-containing protein [Ketogulonicigenium robustum]ARO14598.1 hypothetical protein BVG79_01252 [Ketogulonicigenium robustum]
MTQPVLFIRDLRAYFTTERGIVESIDGVTFDIHRGETLAIVGDSGSGKSVTSLSIMELLPRRLGRVAGCEITFTGRDTLFGRNPPICGRCAATRWL